MSTLLLSPSDRPFVTRGTALTPPLPVLVATPAPLRLNQVSRVMLDAPSAGAGPKVTWSLAPSSARAPPARAEGAAAKRNIPTRAGTRDLRRILFILPRLVLWRQPGNKPRGWGLLGWR